MMEETRIAHSILVGKPVGNVHLQEEKVIGSGIRTDLGKDSL
jgi:hypothetical protein